MADGPKDLRTTALTAADFDQGKDLRTTSLTAADFDQGRGNIITVIL
jgi:hypothetical protein